VLLTVSRLDPHDQGKNIDAIIRAMPAVLERRPGARLQIVGDGALRAELETLAGELGVGGSIDFLGRVGDDALEEAYRQARVFVLPSEKEGFGIVYLEAWQRGLPVICGTGDAGHEIVADGEDGFAVDPADVAALAGRMAELLDDPAQADRMGLAGYRKVRANYLDRHFRKVLGEVISA
jgi:glycosyltransferase involved in cell wall biosynthesis